MAKSYDKVYYPCRRKDFNSVRSFFLLQPKIEVVPIDTESPHPDNRGIKQGSEDLRLGFYSSYGMDKGTSFAQNFYRQAGVSYDVRWDCCPIQEVVETFYGCDLQGSYFFHEDKDRAFRINYMHVHGDEDSSWCYAYPSKSSLLCYAPIMKTADIHVIDGPFLHLAESIETTGRLFYHKYARPLSACWSDVDCPTRKKWNVLT